MRMPRNVQKQLDYERLYQMESEDALEYLSEVVLDHLLANSFEPVEEMMAKLDLQKDDLLGLCLLSLTLPEGKNLPGRPAFYQRVKQYYEAQGRDAEGLLEGLDLYAPTPGIPDLYQLMKSQA